VNTALAIGALVFGLAGFVAGVLALRTLARIRRSVALLSRGASGRETILDAADRHMAASEAVRTDIVRLQQDLASAQRDAADRMTTERTSVANAVTRIEQVANSALRRVALVRYDAFDEQGGRLSFSLALLDDAGNGVTLTSIATASETRVYAKSLAGGIGEHTLSPEEEAAVRAAMSR
jgi:hypothetical protein